MSEAKNLLLIFVKNPILGKVKTRLAKGIGQQKALEVYKMLLGHTRQVSAALKFPKWVCYTWHIDENDLWNGKGFEKHQQEGEGLGERMEKSFQKAFDSGYERVCVIGSDCIELQTAHLEKAFQQLEKNDLVIGPAEDGGYYLIGMNKLYPALFRDKTWSTSSVLPDTLQNVKEFNLSCSLLPILSDIDNLHDLEKFNIEL